MAKKYKPKKKPAPVSDSDSYSDDEEESSRRSAKKSSKPGGNKGSKSPAKTIDKKRVRELKTQMSRANPYSTRYKKLAKELKKLLDEPTAIKTTIISYGGGYAHEFDPYTRYVTERAAKHAENALRKRKDPKDLKKLKGRVTTLYSIMQDTRENIPEKRRYHSAPLQGPHTIPHYLTIDTVTNARAQGELAQLAQLRLTPEEYNSRLYEEIPVGHARRALAQEASAHYKKVYDKGSRLLGEAPAGGPQSDKEKDDELKLARTLHKALELHPYGTYRYMDRRASRSDLAYKGEGRGRPVVVDLPAHAGFKDLAKVRTEVKQLLERYGKFHDY